MYSQGEKIWMSDKLSIEEVEKFSYYDARAVSNNRGDEDT